MLIILAGLFLPACATLLPKGGEPCGGPPGIARKQLLEIESRYRPASTFKGIGHIRMWNSEGSLSARMAFAGTIDGKIRVEILGPAGQPMATLIYNGKRYFFISHTDQQTFEKTASGSAIKRLIGVEITTDELTTLLAGGLPVREHEAVCIQSDPSGVESIIALRNGWWERTVEKLFIDPRTGQVRQIEMYDSSGLQYRISYQEQRPTEGFLIPFQFELSDDQGNGLRIRMDRYWPNAKIKADLFTHEEFQ